MVSDNNQSIWTLNSKYVIFALLGILSSFLSYSSSVLVWTNTIKANRTASRERAEYFECIRRGVGEIPFRTRSSTYPHHKYPPCNTSKNVPVSVKGVGGGKKCVPASAAEVRCELCTVICKNDCWLTAPNESSQVRMDYSSSESIHLSQKWSMAMAALYKENRSDSAPLLFNIFYVRFTQCLSWWNEDKDVCADERTYWSEITVLNGNLSISHHIWLPWLSAVLITRQAFDLLIAVITYWAVMSQHNSMALSFSLMWQGNLPFNYCTQTTSVEEAILTVACQTRLNNGWATKPEVLSKC